MTDLIAFLSARLDEARAKAASSDPVGAMEAHFEVEADRKLIALHAVEVRREERRAGYDEIAEGKPPVYWADEYSCVICGWFDAEQGACETVRIRAERFSDHQDYDPEWKP